MSSFFITLPLSCRCNCLDVFFSLVLSCSACFFPLLIFFFRFVCSSAPTLLQTSHQNALCVSTRTNEQNDRFWSPSNRKYFGSDTINEWHYLLFATIYLPIRRKKDAKRQKWRREQEKKRKFSWRENNHFINKWIVFRHCYQLTK